MKFCASSAKENLQLAGILVSSVILFILAFAAAASWVVFAEHGIQAMYATTPREAFNTKSFAILASVLTIVTVVVSLIFGFATRNHKTEIPFDFRTIIKNGRLKEKPERKPEGKPEQTAQDSVPK